MYAINLDKMNIKNPTPRWGWERCFHSFGLDCVLFFVFAFAIYIRYMSNMMLGIEANGYSKPNKVSEIEITLTAIGLSSANLPIDWAVFCPIYNNLKE